MFGFELAVLFLLFTGAGYLLGVLIAWIVRLGLDGIHIHRRFFTK